MIERNKQFLSCVAALLGVVSAGYFGSKIDRERGLEFEPNVGALKGSPYGKTIGMALQGPVVSFWDSGIGGAAISASKIETSLPFVDDLGARVLALKNSKSQQKPGLERNQTYRNHVYGKIEKKLRAAWEMDPTNFSNYALYQMFLYEQFDQSKKHDPGKAIEVCRVTIEAGLSDSTNPSSVLTMGEAAFDLVLTAASFPGTFEMNSEEVEQWSTYLPKAIALYQSLESEMKESGRWQAISEMRKQEFDIRFKKLVRLDQDRGQIMRNISLKPKNNKKEMKS